MDEPLRFADRMAMHFHLALCRNCSRFAKQLHEIRHLFRKETGADDDVPGLTPDARQRIETELQKKLDA